MNVAMVTANSCALMSPDRIPAPVTQALSSTQTAGRVKVHKHTHTQAGILFLWCQTDEHTPLLFLQMWMSVQMNRALTPASTPTGPSCATVTRDSSWRPTVPPASVRQAGCVVSL